MLTSFRKLVRAVNPLAAVLALHPLHGSGGAHDDETPGMKFIKTKSNLRETDRFSIERTCACQEDSRR